MLPAAYAGEHPALELIQQSDRAPLTKALYCQVIRAFLGQGYSLTSAADLLAFCATASESRKRTLRAALGLWVREVCDRMQATVTPENLHEIQATMMRLRALPKMIKTRSPKGRRAHTWLTSGQIRDLMATCEGDELGGLRDRVIIGLLLATGMRREEVTKVRWEHIVTQPHRGDARHILNVQGKGAKSRAVPLTQQTIDLLDQWGKRIGRAGYVVRSIGKGGKVGASLTRAGVHNVIKSAGERIGIPELSPHDLRRTAAQMWYQATGDILIVSDLLGHENIQTTRRYLSVGDDQLYRAVQAVQW